MTLFIPVERVIKMTLKNDFCLSVRVHVHLPCRCLQQLQVQLEERGPWSYKVGYDTVIPVEWVICYLLTHCLQKRGRRSPLFMSCSGERRTCSRRCSTSWGQRSSAGRLSYSRTFTFSSRKSNAFIILSEYMLQITKWPNIYCKSVLHRLKHRFAIYFSRLAVNFRTLSIIQKF